MNADEAQAYLESVGFVPGHHKTLGMDPEQRAQVKAACRVLKDARRALAAPPPPPEPEPDVPRPRGRTVRDPGATPTTPARPVSPSVATPRPADPE